MEEVTAKEAALEQGSKKCGSGAPRKVGELAGKEE